MPLSDSDMNKIREWLQRTGRNRAFACPWCGGNNWQPSNELAFAVAVDSQTGRINHLAGVPMVAVACNECSYIMLFSAKAIGIMRT